MASYKDALIRKLFDAERDILWVESVNKEAKRLGVDVASLEYQREAFNQHLENRDWEWCKNNDGKKSIAELEKEMEDTIERADAIGIKLQRKGRTSA
jgi:hypothetical protein